ncbi:MAG TPA: hypothetical protein VN285_03865 [Candidatus Deferrimicrobium sp.]|nr:hypothetical protein [Candidatus Deferrimicrobium sp.]
MPNPPRLYLAWFLLGSFGIIWLGNDASSADVNARNHGSPLRAEHEGRIIDSVVIENRNIYDTESDHYRHFVFEWANRLHYKTRAYVVGREVLLRPGAEFSIVLAEETARNLRQRLPLFDAWVETRELSNGHLLVRVVTVDTWSLTVGLSANRDANETRYRVSLAERNLAGNNQYLAADYVVQSTDDNFFVGRFRDSRVLGQPIAFEVSYGDDPLSSYRQLSLGHPFYNRLQTYMYHLTIGSTGGRHEVHRDNVKIAWSGLKGDLFSAQGAFRFGPYLRKVEISSRYLYRFNQSFDEEIWQDATSQDTLLAAASLPEDSVYHQFGLAVRLSNLKFAELQRIDGFNYTEDFVLGQALHFGVARAMSANLREHIFDFIDGGISLGGGRGRGVALLTYHRAFWFRGARDIRRTARLTMQYYQHATNILTIAMQANYQSDDRSTESSPLSIGGVDDIRGYERFFQSGNRKASSTIEGRFYPGLEILSVLFGGAVFVDAARAWDVNERITLKGVYFSVGLGLRIALARGAKDWLVRVDFAYAERTGWRISIGGAQYFRSQADSFLLTTR